MTFRYTYLDDCWTRPDPVRCSLQVHAPSPPPSSWLSYMSWGLVFVLAYSLVKTNMRLHNIECMLTGR